MSEELSRQEKIDQGREARRILESPAFPLVMQRCRSEFVDRWQMSKYDDVKMRETAYNCIHALAEIEHQLRSMMDEGLVEEDIQKKQK